MHQLCISTNYVRAVNDDAPTEKKWKSKLLLRQPKQKTKTESREIEPDQ
jgi:hypothetical protein